MSNNQVVKNNNSRPRKSGVNKKPVPSQLKESSWDIFLVKFKDLLHGNLIQLLALIFFTIIGSLILTFIAPLEVGCWSHILLPHETILIQKEPYHIGDVELMIFKHSPPEINPFVKSFHICRVTETMRITMQATHVDPDSTSSPISIFINGQFIDYLNSYSEIEQDDPVSISIELQKPMDVLKVGHNSIMIFSGADFRGLEYGIYNTDDIEFWDLKIER